MTTAFPRPRVHIALRVRPGLKAKVEQVARSRNITVSSVWREIINAGVAAHPDFERPEK